MEAKIPLRGVMVVVAIVCLGAGELMSLKSGAQKAEAAMSEPENNGPVASVRVAPIKEGSVSTYIMVYGDVVPAPGAVRVASVPYEIRVNRVMVSTGQKVSRGDPLLEIEPSPDTLLQLEQAKTSYKISKQNLNHVKQLFDLKLATNTQMLKTEETFKQASSKLENLKKMGVDGKRIIRSTESGLVSNVNVQEGAIVADGQPLAGVIGQNHLEVRLGVEPNAAERLVSGQSISLSPVNEPALKQVTGKVRKISRAISPSTRLVDVFVSLPRSCGFLLGEYIMGRIETASSYGMIVPRSAVLPEGGKDVLYTVGNGHAVKHAVQTGIGSGNQIRVSGGGLKHGDEVVVLGNYELKDGMSVKVEGGK